jgi:hypothetical protein
MIFLGEIWHLGNEKKVGVANGVRVISLGKGWVHVTIFRQIVSSISCQSVAGFLNFSICGSPSQVVLLSSWTWVLPFCSLYSPFFLGALVFLMIGRVSSFLFSCQACNQIWLSPLFNGGLTHIPQEFGKQKKHAHFESAGMYQSCEGIKVCSKASN